MSVRKYCIWLMARSDGFSLHFLWALQGPDWRLVSLMCSWPSDCPALHSLICGPGRPPHRLPESLDSWYTPQQLHHNTTTFLIYTTTTFLIYTTTFFIYTTTTSPQHSCYTPQQLHNNILDIHHNNYTTTFFIYTTAFSRNYIRIENSSRQIFYFWPQWTCIPLLLLPDFQTEKFLICTANALNKFYSLESLPSFVRQAV